ncbi:DUF3800 domain-containing protein [Vibrio lentus]|uniref:DUF3800 domain-containing protein n=1 Tax=Vibrio kanaloae TaxID=170673 RepID=UPI001EFD13A4|nr:DUF3800 domain-containing protein [Vibrio kanaloae]MCG9559645.1 DUF3800 domain-containing protein [Vibrio kanaloae]
MKIYIDESGSFVNAPDVNSWNTVVAYAVPETETRKIRELLRLFKVRTGHKATDEIKLKNVDEAQYCDFLKDLNQLKGVAFCVATDSGCNTHKALAEHQTEQTKAVLKNKDKMIYESGKAGVQEYADKMAGISPQLYAQLYCQTALINIVINRAINYFAARFPRTLSKFCWRIDQKSTNKNDYERVFETLSPAFLQSQSIREPLIMIREFDYSAMFAFEYAEGEMPDYLEKAYGIPVQDGMNIGKVMRDDFQFVDSKDELGVQIADLLSAGFRKCLRGGFMVNDRVAELLGTLLVHDLKLEYPVRLVGFTEHRVEDPTCIKALEIMKNKAQSILKS